MDDRAQVGIVGIAWNQVRLEGLFVFLTFQFFFASDGNVN